MTSGYHSYHERPPTSMSMRKPAVMAAAASGGQNAGEVGASGTASAATCCASSASQEKPLAGDVTDDDGSAEKDKGGVEAMGDADGGGMGGEVLAEKTVQDTSRIRSRSAGELCTGNSDPAALTLSRNALGDGPAMEQTDDVLLQSASPVQVPPLALHMAATDCTPLAASQAHAPCSNIIPGTANAGDSCVLTAVPFPKATSEKESASERVVPTGIPRPKSARSCTSGETVVAQLSILTTLGARTPADRSSAEAGHV